MGDPTAAAMGRLTLNPVKHMDIVGTIVILVIGFGWAKPVPINPRNFRNPKAGMAISAAAGPISNILMAMLGVIIYRIIWLMIIKAELYEFDMVSGSFTINSIANSAQEFFGTFYTLNLWFAVFNLIPIPPLDGSRIVSYFLPPRLYHQYNYLERYGFIILILMLNMDRFGFRGFNLISGLQTVAGWILSLINFIIDPVFKIFGG